MKNLPLPPLKILVIYLLVAIWFSACEEPGPEEGEEPDPFGENIRKTDPLTPDEERLSLHLPPGFEIQLFASEPDISKPLNMSFDSKGRMWVTQSNEYPFPDSTGVGKDKISILEDTNGDGTADKISVFADSLNIPIGLQVVPDGVIAYSIPNIWHLVDTDGDDKVDQRKVLYSGFKYGDTHGMVNNFVRSWDGWIHADHGFSNTSTVAGSDGDTIVMFSGNTFRFRMDGSHVEFTTTGRVNPYGYAYDELGYEYSTDCHTSPVYQLVRGADYPHFGKKPTGIGFGPALMKHDYGSTALAGLDYYLANQFPAEYKESFYYGDVVRSRVSRSNFTMLGTTPVINQEEDFIISDDPWFRPVDVKLGPDGAIYVADFYNRIIGHYEVPLDHPGRDRERGRIWRIVYTGEDVDAKSERRDWSNLSLDELIANLDHANLPLRMSFADQIVDRFGKSAIPQIQQMLKGEHTTHSYIQGLWILYRLNAISDELLASSLENKNDTIKVHALRVIFEQSDLHPGLQQKIATLLYYPNPHVQRQATMVLGNHPTVDQVPMLIDLLEKTDPEDTHFFYSIRQSLRNQLRDEKVLDEVLNRTWEERKSRRLADVMVGVDAPLAADFLLSHIAHFEEPLDTLINYTKHASRWIASGNADKLVSVVRPLGSGKPDAEYKLLLAFLEGQNQDGKKLSTLGTTWAKDLTKQFLENPIGQYEGWGISPIEHKFYPGDTWDLVDSTGVEDVDSEELFLASGLTNGKESSASIRESPPFKMPSILEFTLLGRKHDGNGKDASPPQCLISLVDLASGEIIQTQDILHRRTNERISWNAEQYEGAEVFLRLLDGSAGRGEFIAIGHLEPAVLTLPRQSPRKIAERQIFAARTAADLVLNEVKPDLYQILESDLADVVVRNEAAVSLLALNDKEINARLDGVLKREVSSKFVELLVSTISNSDRPEVYDLMLPHLSDVSYQTQKDAVLNLSGSLKGIDFLFEGAGNLSINPRLLLEPLVIERLEAGMNTRQKALYKSLTKEIKPPGENIDKLITDRLRGFRTDDFSVEKGKALFGVFCSTCHQISGQGGDIGPQLDGVGNWGSRALTEKILDPNRNISKAFSTYTIKLKDGTTRFGLFRREEGQTTVFANDQGQEFSIEKSSIVSQTLSPYTLMPDYFRETIPVDDFHHLLTYLINLKQD